MGAGVTPFQQPTASQRVRCADWCSAYIECQSFAFNNVSMVCQLYENEYILSELVSEGLTNYYIERDT